MIKLINEKVKGSDLVEFLDGDSDASKKAEAEFDEKSKDIPLDENDDPIGYFNITVYWSEE